jgi:hypothetical protein
MVEGYSRTDHLTSCYPTTERERERERERDRDRKRERQKGPGKMYIPRDRPPVTYQPHLPKMPAVYEFVYG